MFFFSEWPVLFIPFQLKVSMSISLLCAWQCIGTIDSFNWKTTINGFFFSYFYIRNASNISGIQYCFSFCKLVAVRSPVCSNCFSLFSFFNLFITLGNSPLRCSNSQPRTYNIIIYHSNIIHINQWINLLANENYFGTITPITSRKVTINE